MARPGALLWLFATAFLVTPPAAADPSVRTSALSWTRLPGAESCVGSRDLARAVERRLDRAVFVPPSSAELTVEARVEKAAAPGFRAVVRVVDGDGAVLGTRELETADESCASLTMPLTLAIALMVDPDAPPPRAPRESVPPAAPAGPPAAMARDTLVQPAPRENPWRFQVDAGPALAAGFLPDIAPGVEIRALLDPDGFPAIQVMGAYWQTHAGVTYRLAYAGVGVCPLTMPTVVARLSTCAGFAVGAIHANGGFEGILDVAAHPYLDIRAGRRLFGPMLTTLGLGIAAPLFHRTFRYDPPFAMSPVAVTADLGIGVEVP